MASPPQSNSWADDVEFDEEFLDESPVRTESAVDEQGVKTIVDVVYRDGKPYKVTKKIRIVKRNVRINKHAQERRQNWKKFGKATQRDDGTITIPEAEITFDLTGKAQQSLVDRKAIQQQLNSLLHGGEGTYKAATSKTAAVGGPAAKPTEEPADASKPGAYVAPGKRAGGGTGSSMSRDETHTVRVSNLSSAIDEQDLRDLFSQFGSLQRVHLVKDHATKESKGFGFVSFYRKEDAEKAIKKVTGFGYDHLILQVEWARPIGN